tara:strand:- start:323 stop:682 length:360 start_codon:yes stop_codon:yes gene_type:complete
MGSQTVQVATEKRDGVHLVHLEGSVDFTNHVEVKDALRSKLDGDPPHMLLVLDGVESVDSSGLAVFIAMGRELARRGGQLKFCSVPDRIADLFQMTRLNLVFESYPGPEEALASFSVTD